MISVRGARGGKRVWVRLRAAHGAGGGVHGPGATTAGAALPIAAAIALRLATEPPSCIVSTAVLGTMTIVALSRFRPS
jgi:hypothetical protein